jgi:hypothetical protein
MVPRAASGAANRAMWIFTVHRDQASDNSRPRDGKIAVHSQHGKHTNMFLIFLLQNLFDLLFEKVWT